MTARPWTMLLLAALAPVATADIFTVDDDGPADFSSIQGAINASSDGDTILVAPGTYTLDADNVVNTLGKAISVASTNGPSVTIINGQSIRRGIACESGETEKTIIDGFTIRNCYATWYDWNGNGNPDYWEYFGGGMWNRNGSRPTVRNCVFLDNEAEYGGAVYNGDSQGVNASPTFENCTFIENGRDDGVGGGLYNNASTPHLVDCLFTGNFAAFGGGICNFNGSGGTITGCEFDANFSTIDGGAIYNDTSNPTATGCLFTDNWSFDDGGAVFNAEASSNVNIPVFIDCAFTDNDCDDEGGAIHNFSISPVFSNCTITDNSAESGGGMYSWNSSNPKLDGTSVCENDPNQISGNWTDNGGNLVDASCEPVECPTDFNGDGVTDGADLGLFFVEWGACDAPCPADLNGDGEVDGEDLGLLFVAWGPCG
ncbi:MAG: hypothetical protein MK085_11025 [Phycisphaerales bacterium]|nr:hypothetical protein [Phycisphaerales bacterium]